MISIALIVFYNLIDFWQSRSLGLQQVSYQTLTEAIPGEFVTIRSEYVILAPEAGEFIPELAEGQRVKKNGSIGYLKKGSADMLVPDTILVYAGESGLISYELDGWEDILRPDTLGQLDWLHLLNLMHGQTKGEDTVKSSVAEQNNELAITDPQAATDVPNVAAGRSLARIVDNLVDYQLFFCADADLSSYQDQSWVELCLDISENAPKITAKVLQYGVLSDGSNYLLLSVSSTVQALFQQRYHQGQLVGNSHSGVTVPNEAIFTVDGKNYVYIRKKSVLVQTEVEIVQKTETVTMVTGLNNTAIVVINPGNARDGQEI
ncbi:MAG: HlyD family efflux transporter periplasmic adaptor subunit [Clostridiales bacterium]